MAIDRDTVRKVAHLARLELDEETLARYQTQLGAILDYIDQLKKLDVEKVDPMAHPRDFANVFREDVPRPCLTTEEALKNAPAREGPYFVVPKIIE